MANEMNLVSKFSYFKHQKLALVATVICFFCSMTFLVLFIPRSISFPTLNLLLSVHTSSSGPLKETKHKHARQEWKPLCDVSDRRSDLCAMNGDIRIHGNSSSILYVTLSSSQTETSPRNESYRIRPYARKENHDLMSHVREVSIRASTTAPHCMLRHSIPAIVFSLGGYAGNFFHDFTDILIPLFSTARQFDGEVQFLVTNLNPGWAYKFQVVLRRLSRYQIIDFDKDDRVHCFKQAFVGLRCHKELSIDPSRSPNGYSMLNFTQFMRSAYSLGRHTPIKLGKQQGEKPRLAIITRRRTRSFLNEDEIIQMAEELGCQVVTMEPSMGSNVTEFARIVNSCDVMIGVHGAGLTNLVFLPTNSVLIQIVPWGGLHWIANYDFGDPARDMKLEYLEYQIRPEESSLIEQYPIDHQVFKNPFAFHKLGWDVLKSTFLDKQNVRLNVTRFRAVLLQALELLHE